MRSEYPWKRRIRMEQSRFLASSLTVYACFGVFFWEKLQAFPACHTAALRLHRRIRPEWYSEEAAFSAMASKKKNFSGIELLRESTKLAPVNQKDSKLELWKRHAGGAGGRSRLRRGSQRSQTTLIIPESHFRSSPIETKHPLADPRHEILACSTLL